MATEKVYYKNDKEYGILQRDVDTYVSFVLPTDPFNEGDVQQMIKFFSPKYPELNKIYYATRGEEIKIPKYIYDRVVKNSHLFAGHVKAKIKQAK